MKLIQGNSKPVKNDGMQKVIGPLQKLLPIGKKGEQAEEDLITRLLRGLDNRFVMVRNLPLDGTNECFPPIVLGPTGLVLLNVSLVQGVFRARDDTWWELSKATQRYNPGRPNLIKESLEYAQKLSDLLTKREKSHPEVVPVLLFANSGVHIESTNPAIRIVLVDGVETLISNILMSEEVLTPNEINYLADAFEFMGNPEKAIPMGEGEDFFGRDLLEPEKKFSFSMPKFKLPAKFSLAAMEEKMKFSPRQWLILEVLMIFVILILIIAIIYVLVVY